MSLVRPLERLVAGGEVEATRQRHLDWCLALVEAAAPRLRGADQGRWLTRLETEHDNLRAALSWAMRTGAAETAQRLAGGLTWFWYHHGLLGEGRRWLEQALGLDLEAATAARAQALLGAGRLAHYQGDAGEAALRFEGGLALYRALGDATGTAAALYLLAVEAEDRGDFDLAAPLFAEALPLFEATADPSHVAMTHYHLGVVAYGRGDLARAAALCAEGRRLATAAGDEFGAMAALSYLGLVRCDRGEYEDAIAALVESLSVDRATGHQEGIARDLASLATVAQAAGQLEVAAPIFGAVDALVARLGYAFGLPERARYERAVTDARAALGEDSFVAATAAGRVLSLDEAIAAATAVWSEAPAPDASANAAGSVDLAGLSPREIEVLRLLAGGNSDREIATALSISPRTVMRHVGQILAKLEVDSRTAAATRAVRGALV